MHLKDTETLQKLMQLCEKKDEIRCVEKKKIYDRTSGVDWPD